MRLIFLASILAMLHISCSKNTPLEKVLNASSEKIQKVMNAPENYEVQIIYTQIDRDEMGAPILTDFEYNLNDSAYFYPASTVKFPIALIALEKLKKLQQKGINIDRGSYFRTENDSTYSSIEKSIKEIFAISDNEAYNRLFEFLGQDFINQSLSSKNISGRISHRLSTDNAYVLTTKPIVFTETINDSVPIYEQASISNQTQATLQLEKLLKGKGFMQNDTLIKEPMDFSKKNYLPLRSLHEMMKRIQFPDLYDPKERFAISEEDRGFILEAMQTLPKEAGYDKTEYYDGYVKFFLFGDTKNDIPETIKIYNKVGYAYGYLTDCAYIKDTQNNIEFLLSATIHVNQNQIFNDNHYEYDDIGIPFLAELGRGLYELELQRQKKQ